MRLIEKLTALLLLWTSLLQIWRISAKIGPFCGIGFVPNWRPWRLLETWHLLETCLLFCEAFDPASIGKRASIGGNTVLYIGEIN